MSADTKGNRLRDYQPEFVVLVELFSPTNKNWVFGNITNLVTKCIDTQKFDGVGTAQIDVVDKDGRFFDNLTLDLIEGDNRVGAYNDIQSYFNFNSSSASSLGGIKRSSIQFNNNYFNIQPNSRKSFALRRMRFVVIYKKDIFGFWNKRFTGIISTVSFNYTPGGVPTFSLQCVNLRRLLQISEIVTQKALGGQIAIQSLQQALQPTISGMSNIFSGQQSYDIIRTVIDTTNQYDQVINNIMDTYNFQHRRRFRCNIFTFCPNTSGNYNPIDDSVITKFTDAGYSQRFMNNLNYSAKDGFKGFTYTLGSKDEIYSDYIDTLQGISVNKPETYVNHFAVDWSILNGVYGIKAYLAPVYTKMFNQFTNMWRNEYVTADAICSKVAEMMFGFFYCDADGNYILSQPLLNTIPSISKNRFKDIDYYGMPSHGYNYIITDYSLLNFNMDENESEVYTSVEVPGDWDFNMPNSGGEGQLYNGLYPNQAFLKKLISKQGITTDLSNEEKRYLQILWDFGSRNMKTSPIIGVTDKTITDAAAKALYSRQYHRAFNANFTFEGRSDFQIGRTIYCPYNNYLYLPMIITDTLVPGESHTTQLSCSYGHPIEHYIEDPWDAMTLVIHEKVDLENKKKIFDQAVDNLENKRLMEKTTPNVVNLLFNNYDAYKKEHPKDKSNAEQWLSKWKTLNQPKCRIGASKKVNSITK